MINGLIAAVFAARNQAHLEHWNTKSYAQHVALGEFYDGIIDLIDGFVECYQGLYGLIGKVKLIPTTDKLVDLLVEDSAWMDKNRCEICKDNKTLENILDTIIELYLTTLYKLENLE